MNGSQTYLEVLESHHDHLPIDDRIVKVDAEIVRAVVEQPLANRTHVSLSALFGARMGRHFGSMIRLLQVAPNMPRLAPGRRHRTPPPRPLVTINQSALRM